MIFEQKVMQERVGYANFNEGAKRWMQRRRLDESFTPFTDPDTAYAMQHEYHLELDLDWSYGGWMEDRSCIRRGTYLEKDKLWIHTGIDVNRGVGSLVRCLGAGTIVHIGTDAPLVGGWGYHMIQLITFKGKTHGLLYAHLADGIIGKVGMKIKKGAVLGAIGHKHENGYWRPHLHLQLFADVAGVSDWDTFSKEMDGYVRMNECATWARRCPDPTPLIFA